MEGEGRGEEGSVLRSGGSSGKEAVGHSSSFMRGRALGCSTVAEEKQTQKVPVGTRIACQGAIGIPGWTAVDISGVRLELLNYIMMGTSSQK